MLKNLNSIDRRSSADVVSGAPDVERVMVGNIPPYTADTDLVDAVGHLCNRVRLAENYVIAPDTKLLYFVDFISTA